MCITDAMRWPPNSRSIVTSIFPCCLILFPDSFVTREATWPSAGQGGIKTHSPEVSEKDILLLKKGMGASSWQAGTSPCPLLPAEKAETILPHDLEETDLGTKASTLRMEELQKVREGPALNDICDLRSQTGSTLPWPAKVLDLAIIALAFSFLQFHTSGLIGVSLQFLNQWTCVCLLGVCVQILLLVRIHVIGIIKTKTLPFSAALLGQGCWWGVGPKWWNFCPTVRKPGGCEERCVSLYTGLQKNPIYANYWVLGIVSQVFSPSVVFPGYRNWQKKLSYGHSLELSAGSGETKGCLPGIALMTQAQQVLRTMRREPPEFQVREQEGE